MKEDVLEQIMEDYFLKKGFFTKHNIKYRPDSNTFDYVPLKDSGYSDIDILAINPLLNDGNIISVSCKSYQNGFNIKSWIKKINELDSCTADNIRNWGRFRELANPKWTKAFVNKIEELTGTKKITYILALTKITGFGRIPSSDKVTNAQSLLNNCKKILDNFKNAGASVNFKVLTFKDIFDFYFEELSINKHSTLESSEIGRLIQLIQAAGINFNI